MASVTSVENDVSTSGRRLLQQHKHPLTPRYLGVTQLQTFQQKGNVIVQFRINEVTTNSILDNMQLLVFNGSQYLDILAII